MFTEMDQYASSLAIEEPLYRAYLLRTYDFWLSRFVDRRDKGIWHSVNQDTRQPPTGQRKHWEWRSGFHEMEHALVSYLAAGAIHDESVALYFAVDTDNTNGPIQTGVVRFDRAYTFYADSISMREMRSSEGELSKR
jgi:hypothetical protein